MKKFSSNHFALSAYSTCGFLLNYTWECHPLLDSVGVIFSSERPTSYDILVLIKNLWLMWQKICNYFNKTQQENI